MKNILITGVSKGLGLNITKKLLSKGYTVYGISRSKSIEFEKLELEFGDKLKWCSIDLTKSIDLKRLFFDDFLSNKIPISVFINNAAIAYDDIITNMNESKLLEMYQSNVINPLMFTKYVIRNMILNKVKGHIIHISSISVHTGYKGLAMYASTKGALEAFSKTTAREWGEQGIRSNCIVAGFMETNMSKDLTSEQKKRIYMRTSLKEPTSMNSISSMIDYLITEDSWSITGQNIFIDGGTI